MLHLALVAAGGALGAVGRYSLSLAIGRALPMTFPLATLLINIFGSLAMGIFVGLMGRLLLAWQEEARLFVAVGVLGGFTTFSAFSLDAITLFERGAHLEAGLYVVLSVVVCLAALYLGLLIVRGGPA